MKNRKLEDIIEEIRAEDPSEEAVRSAAKRVFRHVFDAAYIPGQVERIRGCPDFRALIPSYLSGSLTGARGALVEDHLTECVECRNALREERNRAAEGRTEFGGRQEAHPRRRYSVLPLALAASLVVGLALGITGAFHGLLPGQQTVRATVVSVQGTLYRVSAVGATLVEAGAVLKNADELRTAKGSRAIFRLLDGAQVEMGERSDVSLSSGWRTTSVNLERGRLIVQPGNSTSNGFLLAAGSLRIPARNAIFSVDRGIKGSRIAVAKGRMRVERPEKTVELRAGQQFSTDYRLVNASLGSEFAWSQNADYYDSLIKELSTLQNELRTIPAPELRYSTDLAQYVPSDAVVYAAIPNLGGTLAEAKRMFDERLAESGVLRDWWQQRPFTKNGDFDRALAQISSLSQFLGGEIVVSVEETTPQHYGAPIFLAAVRQTGLGEYLERNIPATAGVRIITTSTGANTVAPGGSLFVFLSDKLAIASSDAAEVQRVAAASEASASAFLQTDFYKRIAQSYTTGASYLLAADMEQIAVHSVSKEVPPGFENVRYLVLERRQVSGETETRAALSFAGARSGIASWLGAPGPMGSFDFVSPDANLAASVVMKTPLTVVRELLDYATRSDGKAAQQLDRTQDDLGVRFADDVAAQFGNDATFAIDGPLLPVPAWKVAIEVYNPAGLQQTIATLIQHVNQLPTNQGGNSGVKLEAGSEQVNSRTFYFVRNSKNPSMIVYYTFVDGYLLAGPSEGNLLQAIQNRQTGYTLASSAKFRNQLPADSYTNFSALLYHDAGSVASTIADQIKSSPALSGEQQRSLSTLLSGSTPGLICAYGEPDRIVAASKSEFLGFDLRMLAVLGAKKTAVQSNNKTPI